MRKRISSLILAALFPAILLAAGNSPLQLLRTIPLPGLQGHFDHLAVDSAGHRLFLAAEDAHVIEVVNFETGRQAAQIHGVKKPHAIFFMPHRDLLFVTDGVAGACDVFDGRDYHLLKAIKLDLDADSGFYNPATHRLYIVNGGAKMHEPYSFVSVVDTQAEKVVENIKVPDNGPEALRLGSGGRLYVNLNNDNQVGVFNAATGKLLARWGLDGEKDNSPMAIDPVDHRLFVVTRSAPRLLVFDTRAGKIVANLPCSRDADDMVYDRAERLIFVSCGQGFVNIYRQLGPNRYTLAARVPSGPHGKNSVLVPSLRRFFVATIARGGEPARILIYRVA